MVKNFLEGRFPKLARSRWNLTSPDTPNYNCIAWAMYDVSRWWWPAQGYYWPQNVPMAETVDAFLVAFSKFRFTRCKNSNLERGYEKVALFTDANGLPTHAARQLPSGLWTSKLGPFVDIEHELEALEGHEYGAVAVTLKRRVGGGRHWLIRLANYVLSGLSRFLSSDKSSARAIFGTHTAGIG